MPRKKAGRGLTEAAKKLGAVGGKKGGPARARKLTPHQRETIARKGGHARQAAKKRAR